MKHSLYENNDSCYLSNNVNYIIKEKKEKQLIYNIIIFLNNKVDLKRMKTSIVYLLKSLPENICSFNILHKKPFFDEFMIVNESNIQFFFIELFMKNYSFKKDNYLYLD